jgi:hypothetical protein
MFRINPHRHGLLTENMNDASPEERREAISKWAKDDPRRKVMADTAKMLGVTESAAEDEDVHLQSAHDCIRSRISKAKREGKDTKALEARLASIATLIEKKS